MYATIAELTEYAEARGVVLDMTDTGKQQLLVRAVDYIDNNFSFIGTPTTDDYAWPRVIVDNTMLSGVIPSRVRAATLQVAVELAQGVLLESGVMPEPTVLREKISANGIETQYASNRNTYVKGYLMSEAAYAMLLRAGLLLDTRLTITRG